MTINKINESTIMTSSKLLHKCSTKGKSLNLSNTLIAIPFLLTKKPNSPKVFSFGSSAISLLMTLGFPTSLFRELGFIEN
jgi:hypothetical protein